MEQTLTKSNIQILEYFDNYKMKQEKRLLIDQMLQSEDQNEVEWASVYEIDDHYVSNRISDVQTRKAYNELRPDNRDVQTAIKLFKCYIYAEEQNFTYLDDYTMGLENEIEAISNDYIREMYMIRYSVISIASLVAKGYIKEVRQICMKIMNENLDNYYSALVSLWHGNTYILEDPKKAIGIYENALNWAEGSRCDGIRAGLKNSLDFANILIGNYPKYLNMESKEVSNVHNVAFWYISRKDSKVGEELLNTIDYDSLNDVQKGYHHFYRGFISEPNKHFIRAVKHLKLAGEHLVRSLVLHELEKLGFDEDVIDALSV